MLDTKLSGRHQYRISNIGEKLIMLQIKFLYINLIYLVEKK